VDSLDDTERSDKGFGSSGVSTPIVRNMAQPATAENILDPPSTPPTKLSDIVDNIVMTDGIKPYGIWLSNDPFDKRLHVQIDVRGDHPSLGLLLRQCQYRNRPQLVDMALSTPRARINK